MLRRLERARRRSGPQIHSIILIKYTTDDGDSQDNLLRSASIYSSLSFLRRTSNPIVMMRVAILLGCLLLHFGAPTWQLLPGVRGERKCFL